MPRSALEVKAAHHTRPSVSRRCDRSFLDELAEFRRSALEALRQPLEDAVITISRAYAKAKFPARLLLSAR